MQTYTPFGEALLHPKGEAMQGTQQVAESTRVFLVTTPHAQTMIRFKVLMFGF